MSAVHPDPFLELGIAFVDLVFEGVDLEVFGLDFLEKMGDFGGDIRDWGGLLAEVMMADRSHTYHRGRTAPARTQHPPAEPAQT
jgi:hypothetical protein